MSFQNSPETWTLVVQCKRCEQQIPAGVKSVPDNRIIRRCPLCDELRRYRSGEIFEGRVAWEIIQDCRR